MFFLYLLLSCSFLLLNEVDAFDRQLAALKFQCPNPSGARLDKLTIVEARGASDVLYYLWDFSAKPSFFIVQVPLGSGVKFNCSRFLNNEPDSIAFTAEPRFVFGVILNKLYEFNDENDTAIFNPNDATIQTYNGEDFRWNVSFSQNTRPIPLDAFRAVGKPFNASSNGTLEIAVGAYTGDGQSVEPPHIFHTANGSQVDIVLNNFRTTFNNPRFAAQLIILSSLKNLTSSSMVKHTVDDENTPGIFKLNTISFDPSKESVSKNRGYLLYRPLVYTSGERIVTASTGLKQYNLTDIEHKSEVFDESLLKAVFGNKAASLFAKGVIISFGSRQDKFYRNTRYSCWSFVFGTGESPDADSNTLIYLIFFCASFSFVILAALIGMRWVKPSAFLRAKPESHEVLTEEE